MENFPNFLPKAPNKVFNDWDNWGDYLSTKVIASTMKKKYYLSYEDAKKYLKDNYDLKSSTDYIKCKLPTIIPKKPFNIYDEWISWSDFLGFKPYSRPKNNVYLSYDNAKNWIKNNYGSITAAKFREMSKNKSLPDFIPSHPDRTYGNEFISIKDFLNSNKRKSKNYYYSFEEARKISISLGLKSNIQWRKWNSTKTDDRIPSNPDKVYKEKWIDWYDWLGNSKN